MLCCAKKQGALVWAFRELPSYCRGDSLGCVCSVPSPGKSSCPWLHVRVTGEELKSMDAQTLLWTH